MNNKEVKFNILQAFIFQLIIWIIFTISFELGFDDFGFGNTILLLMIYLIIYFFKKDKIIEKYNFDKSKYKVSYITSWIIMGIIFGFIMIVLVSNGVLASSCPGEGWDCFLYGLEYYLIAFIIELKIVVIILIEFILWIISLFNNKIKR